ncbi:acyl-CoA reductase [Streptomyces olivochromogenes]|uniref:acyl-CoA reductase n=1 Tax=Streptomyces olivochromogenes TaxID=1963 RepID=UPI0036C97299
MVARCVGSGFQLIAFDPKVSMAGIGQEGFASERSLWEAADLAAADATVFNQDTCAAARHVCAEGGIEALDRFCALLHEHLGVRREFTSEIGPKTPSEVREAVDGLLFLEPEYRVWGDCDGRGLIVRSPEPVDLHPTHKTVDVVPVDSLLDAAGYATVAAQTVGVYPGHRKAELRDRLVGAGVQRVELGSALSGSIGIPYDAMYPQHRFVNWVVDDDA